MSSKERVVQKSGLVKIDALVKQLDLVKHLAESGYWISTEEVCVLLDLDAAALQTLNFKEPLYSFAWRNFVITQIGRQDMTRMWAIADQQQRTNQFAIAAEQKKLQVQLVTDQPSFQPNSPSTQPVVQTLTPSSHGQAHGQTQQTNGQPTITLPSSATYEGEIFPSAYALVENFFTPAQLERLMQYVQEQEPSFVPTSNSANDPNYRRSMVLHAFPEFSQLITNRINAIMPYILTYLGIPNFTPSNIESQLTLHNDGNYYKIHNDSGSSDTANRVLTYVFYFYREPKSFSGGELIIYDSKIENNFYVAAKSYKTIQPKNNSIVFFLSRYMHEVLNVSCPSKAFLDSRFTINGWVRN